MKRLVVIALLLGSNMAYGQWRLIQPREVYVDVYENQTVYDPYLYPVDKELGYGGNFNIDFDVIKYGSYGLYWDNLLHFDQSKDSGKVRHGGWQYELGLSVFGDKGKSRVELFKQHHSRHIFEETREAHFPVYDRYGVRFRIYP